MAGSVGKDEVVNLCHLRFGFVTTYRLKFVDSLHQDDQFEEERLYHGSGTNRCEQGKINLG